MTKTSLWIFYIGNLEQNNTKLIKIELIKIEFIKNKTHKKVRTLKLELFHRADFLAVTIEHHTTVGTGSVGT